MKINYILEGEGDSTIVFIHGLSDSMDYWRKLSFSLKNDYKILLYDLRGHGESDLGSEVFTMDMLLDDLHNLLEELNIKKVTLAGLSLGGNIALSFAVKYPALVEKLILMSTFSEVDDNLREKFLEFRDAVNMSYEDFFDVIIRYVLPEEIINENREVLDEVKLFKAKTANLKAIEYGINMGISFYITDRLKEMNQSALILWGRDDDIISSKLVRILDDNISDSRLVSFENTKHDLLIGENTSEITDLIRDFV